MIDYKDIFQKYGLHPPTSLYIPTEAEIEKTLKNFTTLTEPVKTNKFIQLCSFHLATTTLNGCFKISDHKRFISSLNLDIEFSKFHPELFYLMSIYLSGKGDVRWFGISFYDFIEEFRDKVSDEILTRFSPEYPLKKMYSSNARKNTISDLLHCMDNDLSDALEKGIATNFVTEVYEYILQEQDKINPQI